MQNSFFDLESASADVWQGRIEEKIKDFSNEQFQLIITSPPYNIGKNYEEKQSLASYLSWQEKIISRLIPKLKLTGSICWQVGNYIENGEVFPLDIYFYPLFQKLGLKLRNRMIWHFNHGLHAQKRLSGRYETLLWFSKSDDYIFNLDEIRIPSKYPGKRHFKGEKKGELSGNPKGKNPSDYWEIIKTEFDLGIIDIPNVKSNHPEKTEHPCQFPVELIERCVLAFTNENDAVLDPFGGVGSTAIACLKHKRVPICVEKEEVYCSIAKQRIQQFFSGHLKNRPMGKQIHQPSGHEKVTQFPLEWRL